MGPILLVPKYTMDDFNESNAIGI